MNYKIKTLCAIFLLISTLGLSGMQNMEEMEKVLEESQRVRKSSLPNAAEGNKGKEESEESNGDQSFGSLNNQNYGLWESNKNSFPKATNFGGSDDDENNKIELNITESQSSNQEKVDQSKQKKTSWSNTTKVTTAAVAVTGVGLLAYYFHQPISNGFKSAGKTVAGWFYRPGQNQQSAPE